MTPYQQAYLDGYMHKEATGGAAALATGGKILGTGKNLAGGAINMAADVGKAALPWFFYLPPAIGVGAGMLHSNLTSPTAIDKETAQRAILSGELDETLAEFQRRKKHSEKEEREKEKAEKNERAIRI